MTTETYDYSSDPNFVAYYAAESQSAETRERFTRVRDRALDLKRDQDGDGNTYDVVDIGCGAGGRNSDIACAPSTSTSR